MISFMPENMEGSKENPFDKQDIDLVKQIDGVTDAKIKEDDSQSYGAK